MPLDTAFVLREAELAAEGVSSVLPQMLAPFAATNPAVAALLWALPMFEAAIKGADTVAKHNAETSPEAAKAAVIDTLTPGRPGAPALN